MRKKVIFSVLFAICLCPIASYATEVVLKVDEESEECNSEWDKDLVVFEEEEEYDEPLEDE